MLDLKMIRSDPEAVRAALARRRAADGLDEIIELDERWRTLQPQRDELRATQKKAGEAIAQAKRSGGDASEALSEMQDVAARVKELDSEVGETKRALDTRLASLPNLPAETAPPEDEVLREVGEAGRTGRDHLELLGSMVDMEAGARLSGSRFAYLRGPVVMLELALVRWALELLSTGHGFEPVVPPVLVREEALYGTGFLLVTE